MVDRKVVLYALAVALAIAGVYSQYVIPASWYPPGWAGLVFDLFLAYGIGLIAFYLLVGPRPLRNYVRRNETAVSEGMRWYGSFSVLSLILVILISAVLLAIEPKRFEELASKTTPIVQAGMADPLFYILLSLFVVGFAEETIFRGYILGTVLTLDGTQRWRTHAVWTSALFAFAHLYYAQTYLELSVIDFVEIMMLGLAFSYAYVLSGGNILIIAVLHGTYDAVSFWSLIPGQENTALAVHYLVILVGAVWALYLYQKQPEKPDQWDGQPEARADDWPPPPRAWTPTVGPPSEIAVLPPPPSPVAPD